MKFRELVFTAGMSTAICWSAAAQSVVKAPAHTPNALSEIRAQKGGRLLLPRAPQAGQPFDDRELMRYIEVESRKLLDAGRLGKLRFDRRTCSLPLTEAGSTKLALAEIAARAEAATLVFGEFFREPKSRADEFSNAAGGFVISESGACVTSLHVANEKNSRGLAAMTRDGRVVAVREVLAADPVNDVAILQLDLPNGVTLPALPLAAEPAPVGSQAVVMSHPDERFFMLTHGIVARHTVWRGEKGDEHFMSVTADFARGSSGCPVLDERGAVVGIVNNTESIYYDSDGKKRQFDLQMVVKNTTPSWVVRRMIQPEVK